MIALDYNVASIASVTTTAASGTSEPGTERRVAKDIRRELAKALTAAVAVGIPAAAADLPTPATVAIVSPQVESTIASPAVPAWLLDALDEVVEISRLSSGFDGQGGLAPTAATVRLAFDALLQAASQGCPVDSVAVSGDGTIALEFVRGEVEAELEVYPGQRFAAWLDRPETDTEFWGGAGSGRELRDALRRIAAGLGLPEA